MGRSMWPTSTRSRPGSTASALTFPDGKALPRPHPDVHSVLLAVVFQRDDFIDDRLPVQFDRFDACTDMVRVLDDDLIPSAAIAIPERQAVPLRGDAGI